MSVATVNAIDMSKNAAGIALFIGGSSAITVSLLAAKSIIFIGLGTNVIPIVGIIVGIVSLILSAGIFLNNLNTNNIKNWISGDKKVDLISGGTSDDVKNEFNQKKYLDYASQEQRFLEFVESNPVLDKSIERAESPGIDSKVALKPDSLELTTVDKLQAGSNLVQWGLVGAGFAGVSSSILFPLSALAGLGSEIATFCSLPKDVSWLRKAMSIPVLSRLLINYNPWIARIFQATSLYNLAHYSTSKISAACREFKQDPAKAVKAGTVHLFNLASGVAFAAESAGLVSLRPQVKKPEIVQETTKTNEDPLELTIGLVYEDNGNPRIQEIVDLVEPTHKEYADRWEMKNSPFITKRADLKGKCVIPNQYDPSDIGSPTFPKKPLMGDCSAYWPKVPVMIDWVKSHMNSGKKEVLWLVDYDGPITNMKENPYFWTRKWLTNPDGTQAHIAVTKDAADWAKYNFPGQNVPAEYNLNGGFWVVRNTPESLNILEKLWTYRDVVHNLKDPSCLTKGMCENQNCLHEQEMAVQMLLDDPTMYDRTFRVVPQVDSETKVGINTSNRQGCFIRQNWPNKKPYDFRGDRSDTNWKPGDIMGQPNGLPPVGQEGVISWGKCVLNPVETKPRLHRIEKMVQNIVR